MDWIKTSKRKKIKDTQVRDVDGKVGYNKDESAYWMYDDNMNYLKRYTVYAEWKEGTYSTTEQIDVDASSYEVARKIGEAVLNNSYEYDLGGKIIKIVERFGLYM